MGRSPCGLALVSALALAACGGGGPAPAIAIDLAAAVDANGEAELARDLQVRDAQALTVDVGSATLVVEAAVSGARFADGGEWMRPRPARGQLGLTLVGDGPARVTLWARGAPPPPVRRERSLTWTDGALLDDPTAIGLARLMATIAADGHGGRLLDAWFRRFATTAHSERAAPAQLMDEVAAAQGPDPSRWDLGALPFVVTGVHNRLDLAPRDGGCGQLRVSMASVHPVYAPLHLIFLFRQQPRADDIAQGGTVHCLGAARRWARLSALDGEAWLAAARGVLDEGLRPERFLLAETVELTVSPWEWRQWVPTPGSAPELPTVLDNPPLFQTIDTEGLNPPGPRREALLSFVAANAAALAARTMVIPEPFRAQSARVPPAAPRTPLSLDGLDPAVLAAYPDLARAIEIVGCPTCHTENANFVQTSPQRVFSPFYDLELVARARRLDQMNAGTAVPTPPFGPLQ